MITVIKGLMLTISVSLAGSIVAKVTLTTALGLIAAWLARASRAAVRHVLLASTFGMMLLLPIASILCRRSTSPCQCWLRIGPPRYRRLPSGVSS
jgi:ABC-type Fe3+-siderophore transport system permease subunit